MTSDNNSFPNRFTKVDDLTRDDHSYLSKNDHCLFLGEYTARKDFSYSATNQLISNFKKPIDRRGKPEWGYKNAAILQASEALLMAIGNCSILKNCTFVPVPPSRIRSHNLYDDRMMQMLGGFARLVLERYDHRLDIRELVEQTDSTVPAHETTDKRPTPNELAALYKISTKTSDSPLGNPIIICDDVLTTGCHYKAMTCVISKQFPDACFLGLFLARRRILEDEDIVYAI